jgi:hypothetical protein
MSVLMDFMTVKDGEFHPVWYNKIGKLNVFLGGTIEGEVQMRRRFAFPSSSRSCPKAVSSTLEFVRV